MVDFERLEEDKKKVVKLEDKDYIICILLQQVIKALRSNRG